MKAILNYEGLYEVDTLGNIYSLARCVLNKNGKPQKYPEKLLKQELMGNGYKRVSLCKNHKVTRHLVHRVVAQAFLANPKNRECVNHIDNDPTNNSVDNLEWCTHSENMIHAQKQGRLFEAQSKGGRTRGVSGILADKITQELIGTTQGCWQVLGIADKRKDKLYFHVNCKVCGNVATRTKSYLIKNHTPNCIKCKIRD